MRSFECKTLTTYAFGRFEPGIIAHENRSARYAKLGHNRLPNMLISSLSSNLNPKSGREMVSLVVVPSKRQTRRQVVSDGEMLLISELRCRPNSTESSYQIVRLVTLINRDLPESNAQFNAPPDVDTPSDVANVTLSDARPARGASPDSEVGSHSERRADFYLSPQSDTSWSIKDQRNASSSRQLSSTGLNRTLDKLGPIYTTDTDLGSLRFSTSEIAALVLCWLLVVLAYTCCLLIFIKSSSKPRDKSISAVRRNKVESGSHKALNISHPYNLQMSDATRTRLDMMLRLQARQSLNESANDQFLQTGQLSVLLGDEFARRGGHKFNSQQLSPLQDSSNVEYQCSTDGQSSNFAYNTIDAVRALRCAASRLAKSRLRYHPNLVAIPEADNEQVQSPSSPNVEADHGSLCEQVSAINHLDTLVQNALSCQCSHMVPNMKSFAPSSQHVETLFSRPTTFEPERQGGRVSRSDILGHIKGKDSYYG